MKRGFTLIELIFVIIIIGILSAVLAPRFDRPTLRQAANQIVSHIRYTQHLAMVDNKFDPSDEFWYKKRWQIEFNTIIVSGESRLLYTIYQDLSMNGIPSTSMASNEIAKNPLNPKQLLTGRSLNDATNSKEMILNQKYNITGVTFSPSCSPSNYRRISFDYLGRPLSGNSSRLTSMYDDSGANQVGLITQTCSITLISGDDDKDGNPKQIVIAIEPETGYTHIL